MRSLENASGARSKWPRTVRSKPKKTSQGIQYRQDDIDKDDRNQYGVIVTAMGAFEFLET